MTKKAQTIADAAHLLALNVSVYEQTREKYVDPYYGRFGEGHQQSKMGILWQIQHIREELLELEKMLG